ncbi:MAG: hypothetical protein AAFQ94_20490 [Bacteroidota bacterium]
MAELDIKDIWAKGKSQGFSEMKLDVDDVIGKKSKNVLYWVKFILWIEFWINVASLPFLVWAIFQHDYYPQFRNFTIFTSILIVMYLFYYQFLINKIKAFDYTSDVYSSLQRIYRYLKFYLLHYRVIVWVFMPLASIYSINLSLEQLADEGVMIEKGSAEYWTFIAFMGGLYLFIILVMHFLVNLIYGRKIKRLKGMISELETQA